jgi:hypothetical protein
LAFLTTYSGIRQVRIMTRRTRFVIAGSAIRILSPAPSELPAHDRKEQRKNGKD